ncbi:MAG: amino acid carrier protein [Spirochaetaceae bacterium]|nr:amino acid carrier protein [Spirochaetaceae bacterium]
MEALFSFIASINNILWGYALLFVLCGTGLFFTFKLKFIQLRQFKAAFKRSFGGVKFKGSAAGDKGMSSFQSLATAVACQMGTGNIVGTSAALIAGGPGAVFWLWVSSFLGMATMYAEAVLAQKYKSVNKDGVVVGGPAFYIRAAFKGQLGKVLSVGFSFIVIFVMGVIFVQMQANAISSAVTNAFPVAATAILGIILALLAGFIFIGGAKRIASFSEKVMPILAVIYVTSALIIIFINIANIPSVFYQIFVGAFNPQAIVGGGLGIGIQQAIRLGIARGLFANEAGLGSIPHAHAVAKVNHPAEQGQAAMMGVFVVFVVVTLTALAILSTGIMGTHIYGLSSAALIPDFLRGAGLAQETFRLYYGYFGVLFIAVTLFFLGFTTIIAVYFFGAQNIKALFGRKAMFVYTPLAIMATFLGAVISVDAAWTLVDFFMALMVFPNIAALLILNKEVSGIAKEFNSLNNKINS